MRTIARFSGLVDYNATTEAITHGKITNLIGKKAREMYQDMPEILEEFSRCFTRETSIKREMLYRLRSTGESKHFAVSYVFVPPDLVLVHTEDITKRKRAEEKIKQAAEEWETTLNSITDLVSIHNKDFKFVRVNKAYADIFKVKPEELIGKTCYEVIHGPKEPHPFCPHKQALEIKKPVRTEFFEPPLENPSRGVCVFYT